jgi:hypothetical protein
MKLKSGHSAISKKSVLSATNIRRLATKKEENVTFPIRLGRVSHSISFHPFALSLLQIDRQVMNREKKRLFFIEYLKDTTYTHTYYLSCSIICSLSLLSFSFLSHTPTHNCNNFIIIISSLSFFLAFFCPLASGVVLHKVSLPM